MIALFVIFMIIIVYEASENVIMNLTSNKLRR